MFAIGYDKKITNQKCKLRAIVQDSRDKDLVIVNLRQEVKSMVQDIVQLGQSNLEECTQLREQMSS